jgi:hypothetical protein
MPSARFETTASAGKRPQIHALDRAATGNGIKKDSVIYDMILSHESNILWGVGGVIRGTYENRCIETACRTEYHIIFLVQI